MKRLLDGDAAKHEPNELVDHVQGLVLPGTCGDLQHPRWPLQRPQVLAGTGTTQSAG